MNINNLKQWLTEQADKAPTYSERCAYLKVLEYITEKDK